MAESTLHAPCNVTVLTSYQLQMFSLVFEMQAVKKEHIGSSWSMYEIEKPWNVRVAKIIESHRAIFMMLCRIRSSMSFSKSWDQVVAHHAAIVEAFCCSQKRCTNNRTLLADAPIFLCCPCVSPVLLMCCLFVGLVSGPVSWFAALCSCVVLVLPYIWHLRCPVEEQYSSSWC